MIINEDGRSQFSNNSKRGKVMEEWKRHEFLFLPTPHRKKHKRDMESNEKWTQIFLSLEADISSEPPQTQEVDPH